MDRANLVISDGLQRYFCKKSAKPRIRLNTLAVKYCFRIIRTVCLHTFEAGKRSPVQAGRLIYTKRHSELVLHNTVVTSAESTSILSLSLTIQHKATRCRRPCISICQNNSILTFHSVPRRKSCTVSVTVEPDHDPDLHGQTLLGLLSDPMVTKGFPILHAAVSSPLSRTYASLYGWVQITNTPGEDWVMDPYPLFQDLNNPFVFWGAEPTLVDAPSREPDVEHDDWTARSFLCYAPDAAMTKHVVPILAFERGFWICCDSKSLLYHRDGYGKV